MAYRTFLDDNGRYWQVWESRPSVFERRKDERRKESASWAGNERRQHDRRLGSRARTSLVDPRLASGWLTFESFTEKRRLAPVPTHWDELPVHELIELWERANPVSRIGDESSAA